jgi:SAM-dependent methyltransferase
VVATEPDAAMLARLVRRVPGAWAVRGTAEQVPLAARSVDAVIAGQAFHWFDRRRALLEAARVLWPGGVLALAWNQRDERVPWVRRLGAVIGSPEELRDPRAAIDDSGLFEAAQARTFRCWQRLDRQALRDLVASRSNVAVLPEADRARVLGQVDALYAEYRRGSDGLLLPYHTVAYRTRVLPWGPTC